MSRMNYGEYWVSLVLEVEQIAFSLRQPLLEEESGALTRAVCRQSTAGHGKGHSPAVPSRVFPARMEGKRLRAFRAHFLFTTSGQDP